MFNRNLNSIILLILGGILTFLINHLVNDTVISSATIGLLGYFIFKILNKEEWSLPFYAGTFVGMVTNVVSENAIFIIIASLFSGVVYEFINNNLKGIGGKLGFSAFVGVFILTIIIEIWR